MYIVVLRTTTKVVPVLMLLLLVALAASPAVHGQVAGIPQEFNGGNMVNDAFAANLDLPDPNRVGSIGQRVACFSATECVMAALVRFPGGQNNDYWNLGLIRFDPRTGQRLVWENPHELNSHYNDHYVIWTNTQAERYVAIKGLVTVGSRFYVLLERMADSRRTVEIKGFNQSGYFVSSTFHPYQNANRNVYAGDLLGVATTSGLGLAVVGTAFDDDGLTTPWFRVYTINPVGGGLESFGDLVILDGAGCNPGTCRPNKLARSATSANRLLIGTRTRSESGGWSIHVMKVDLQGQPEPNWNPGFHEVTFGWSADNPDDRHGTEKQIVGLQGRSVDGVEQVFVLAHLWPEPGGPNDAGLTHSAGLAQLTPSYGVGSPGNHGMRWGQTDPRDAWRPRALALEGDRLVVVGRYDLQDSSYGDRMGSFFSVIDLSGGSLPWPGSGSPAVKSGHRVFFAGGTEDTHRWSVFNDVVPLPLSSGRFVTAGDQRYTPWYPEPAVQNIVMSSRARIVLNEMFGDRFEVR